MNKSLRLLIVEDSEGDALLAVDKLRSDGYDVVFERVETEESMASALDRNEWDIVISDYMLPYFDAISSLELLQKKKSELPFIVLSGTIGEETAVEMMRIGVHDYMMKDNLTRLSSVVERSIKDARIKREHAEVKERLESIARCAKNVIFQLSPSGVIQYVNYRVKDMLGYEPDELVGKNFKEIISKDDISKVLEIARNVMSGNDVSRLELSQKHKNGKVIFMEINLLPTKRNGKVIAVQGMMRDATEHRRGEAEIRKIEALYRILFESSRDALMVLDSSSGKFVSGNAACYEMFGVANKEEFSSLGPWDLSPESQPDGRRSSEKSGEMIKKAVNDGFHNFEWVHKRINGEEFPAYVLFTRIVIADEMFVQATVRDITAQKQSEEEIRSGKSFLDTIFDMSPFAAWISDRDGSLIRTNHVLRETLNLADEKLIGKYNVLKDMNFEKNGVMPLVMAVFEKFEPARFSISWKTDEIGDVNFEGVHSEIYIDIAMFPILDTEGELMNVVCQWIDITERKKVSDENAAQQELMNTIISNIPHRVFWKDKNSVYLGCNNNFAKDAGVSCPEDIIGKPDYDLAWKKEEADFHRKCDQDVIKTGKELINIEETQLREDGKEAFLLTSKVPLRDSNDKIFGILGVYADITELKEKEEEVRQFAKFFTENPNPVLRISKEGVVVCGNKASNSLLTAWHCKEGEKIAGKAYRYVMAVCSSGVNKQDEVECSNGQIFSLVFVAVLDMDYVNVYALDITDRKKAEEQLKNKLNELKAFHEATIDRELQMIELKEEINSLSKDLNRPAPYNVNFDD